MMILGELHHLNIILKFPSKEKELMMNFLSGMKKEDQDDKSKYWFTRDKMDKILKVHDYLDSLPEIGKVLSLDQF